VGKLQAGRAWALGLPASSPPLAWTTGPGHGQRAKEHDPFCSVPRSITALGAMPRLLIRHVATADAAHELAWVCSTTLLTGAHLQHAGHGLGAGHTHISSMLATALVLATHTSPACWPQPWCWPHTQLSGSTTTLQAGAHLQHLNHTLDAHNTCARDPPPTPWLRSRCSPHCWQGPTSNTLATLSMLWKPTTPGAMMAWVVRVCRRCGGSSRSMYTLPVRSSSLSYTPVEQEGWAMVCVEDALDCFSACMCRV